MRISNLLVEGYVQRSGNKIKVGALQLQFYPDHVFYVSSDLDLSIYKDGAFKPPRTNEIYAKDALAHGVPKDFVQVITHFLNTPKDQQEALMPRVEQAIEYIVDQWMKKRKVGEGEYQEPKFAKTWGEEYKFYYDGKLLGLIAPTDGEYIGGKFYDDPGFKTYRKIPGKNDRYIKKHKTRKEAEEYLISKYKEQIMKMEDVTDLGQEPDHEASMAKGQLYNACKNAIALMRMIEDGDNLEGWVAAKITKAADYLSTVHDYMAYEEVSEGRMPPSVIKHKQAISYMTPEQKKKKFAGMSVKKLKQMAWRHGYGPDSNEYAQYWDGVTKDEVPTGMSEGKQKGVDGKACWKGYKRMGTKQKGGKTVDNCVKVKK